MEDKIRDSIRRETAREFQGERATLFRIEKERKLREQIARDRERLFEVFNERWDKDGLELANCLKRLLMNFSVITSYGGIVKSHTVFRIGLSLGEDKALQYIIRYLEKHPHASDHDLCVYLDITNRKLYQLNRTNKDGALWARLPGKWKDELQKKRVSLTCDDMWSNALKHLPGRVMTYLSRARKKSKRKEIREALYLWPRVLREHRKRRKSREDAAVTSNSAAAQRK